MFIVTAGVRYTYYISKNACKVTYQPYNEDIPENRSAAFRDIG